MRHGAFLRSEQAVFVLAHLDDGASGRGLRRRLRHVDHETLKQILERHFGRLPDLLRQAGKRLASLLEQHLGAELAATLRRRPLAAREEEQPDDVLRGLCRLGDEFLPCKSRNNRPALNRAEERLPYLRGVLRADEEAGHREADLGQRLLEPIEILALRLLGHLARLQLHLDAQPVHRAGLA